MSITPDKADRGWRLWSTLAVLAALGTAGTLGFVVIPIVQGGAVGIAPFVAICRAFGVLPGSPARPTPPSQAQPQPVTHVAWTPKTIRELYHADRARGARIAKESCIACHAPDGNSPDPSIPRNSGQSAFAMYKQLEDFKSGARVSPIMSPMVENLDDRAIADVAAYYGHLVRGSLDPQSAPFVGEEIENLVVNGDSRRGLPPCVACHGARAGGPIEVPTLTHQYPEYLHAQLKAFATGVRHNDIYHRMRSVASKLTDREMMMLGFYYYGAQ